MTETGQQIERLQAERARLVKRQHAATEAWNEHLRLAEVHSNRAGKAAQAMLLVDAKLNALLDAKLSTVDTIQRESGEWDAAGLPPES